MSRRPTLLACLLAAALAVAFLGVRGASAGERPAAGPFHALHVIDFDGEIGGLMLAYVTRRVDAAVAAGADCIVLRIDSPGGTVYHSKEIGDLLLAVPAAVHVVAWVPQEALSGAVFAALACDEIVMAPSATLGDCQPIVPGEQGIPTPVGEKAESPLRAWFRAYAETNGYPVVLAQAMVSQRMEVLRVRSVADGTLHFVRGDDYRDAAADAEILPGYAKGDLRQDGEAVVRAGELLTMTGRQAQAYGFIARTFPGGDLPADEPALLAALSAPDARVVQVEMSFSEGASRWLLQVAGILSAIVMLALVMLLFQGPGVMTIVGGAALVLMVLINVTAEQVHGFPLLLVLVGAALLAAEVFLIPGFGVAGVLGFACMGGGFLFLATGSTLGDTGGLDHDALLHFGLQFVVTAIAGLVALLLLSRLLPRVGPAARMVLAARASAPPAPAAATPEAAPAAPAAGRRGVARSALRPAGTAEIDGRLVDVVTDGAWIAAGTPVRVVRTEGPRVTVAPADGA